MKSIDPRHTDDRPRCWQCNRTLAQRKKKSMVFQKNYTDTT